uniref:VHS domain-containing protein n=1 Tax=Peronospora matthiolae TaxID=2874970 RepID=A0AAV1TNF4_9STRA
MAEQVELLVDRATDETLVEPEWALNMALCDCVNAHTDVCEDVVHFLQRRLQLRQSKVALLALILTETLVKNGPQVLHTQVGTPWFLQEIVALADGRLGGDVQTRALLLIRQWAEAFQGQSELTEFQDVYQQLQKQDVTFPEVRNDVPIFTPPSSTTSACAVSEGDESAAANATVGRRTRAQQLEKLQADLVVVQEKMKLLGDLHARGQQGEEMEDVLDFLRQCQQRMNTLIEGGVMGKIDERTLEQCLNVNDSLMKILKECSKPEMKDMMTFDSPPRASQASELLEGVDQLNLDEENKATASAAAASRPVPAVPSMPATFDGEGMLSTTV